jgi:hypothetical protein
MTTRSLAVLVCLAGTAIAGGTWNDTVNFRQAKATSLKVTEPEGFKVTVTTADGDKVSTVPDVFALPDQDAFVKVTLTSPQGESWSKKIEVRAKQQTELAVAFKADATAPAQPAKSRTFVGKFLNGAPGCGKSYNAGIRLDFLRSSDGQSVKQQLIDPGKTVDIEVPGGQYDVRVYIAQGQDYKYIHTSQWEFSKDGWVLGFGCVKGSKTPAIVAESK